jgi:hypothetical protein
MIAGLALALLLLTAGGPAMSLAQDASPSATSIALPVAPGPDECTVQPMPVDELLRRMGGAPLPATPGSLGAGGTPLPAAPFALPEGEPADPATVASITETMVHFFPCRTGSNWLAVFTFYTDDFLRQLREDVVITQQDIEYFATAEPVAPEQYDVFLGLREVRVLPDGRVGALVDQDVKVEEGLEVDYVYFVEEDGRWLIDDAVLAVEEQYPPVASTPTP